MCENCLEHSMVYRTRRDGRVYRKRMTDSDMKDLIDHLDKRIRDGVVRSGDFPKVIVFDWNGTIDARGVGVGIPVEVLMSLKALGKTVIVYTSSVKADRKLFMRKWCQEHGIPYTDNEKILDSADMLVGDKKSDERHAGKHGANFVYTNEFSMEKVLPKVARGDVVRFDGVVAHRELNFCKKHGKYDDCVVVHPEDSRE